MPTSTRVSSLKGSRRCPRRKLSEHASSTCKLCGTDLSRCSLFNFCCRPKLRHDFALKLHESSDEPVDERAVPVSFVVTISGMFVWSCNECRLILMRFRYGIKSAFILLRTFTHTRFKWRKSCLRVSLFYVPSEDTQQ
jgi:hypothetical protein